MPEPTNDQGQGGSASSQGGSAQSTQNTQNTNPGTQGSTTGTSTQATGTDQGAQQQQRASTGYTYNEDRSQWIPPHRLREVSEKQRQAEARAQQLETQVQALVGARPKGDDEQRAEQIKGAFYQLFPKAKTLMELSDEQLQKLLTAADKAESVGEYVNQSNERLAKQTIGRLFSEVADVIGNQLSDESKDDLKAVFGSYIQREVQKAEHTGTISPELQQYLDGDESLVKAFAKKWADRWFTPARRQVVSQEVGRAKKVPNSTGRSQQTQVERPQKFNSIEERMAWIAEHGKKDGTLTFSK
jgi:hypothetical protein